MSLRIRKTLGVRSDITEKEPNKKFIFAFEGEKTEKQYFESIKSNRVELGINDIISIESLERNDPTRSNQLAVVREVNSYLNKVIVYQSSCEDIKIYLKSVLKNYEIDTGIERKDILTLIDTNFINDSYKENLDSFIEGLDEILNGDLKLKVGSSIGTIISEIL